MKIAISGGSGFVGSALAKELQKEHKIVLITRDDFRQNNLLDTIKNCDVIINLAGAPISKKWTKGYKKELLDSRVNTTQALVEAMKITKPKLFISTSAIGIYKNGYKGSEENAIYNDKFLGILAKSWEAEALRAKEFDINTTIFRFGVVLGNGGALKQMETPFKLGLGGSIGDGENMMSWISLEDVISAIKFAIDNKCSGIYNLTSPNPLSNRDFSMILADVLNKPMFLSVPKFILKLKFGEGSVVVTDSLEIYPKRLLTQGFKFKYPNLKECLENIYK